MTGLDAECELIVDMQGAQQLILISAKKKDAGAKGIIHQT